MIISTWLNHHPRKVIAFAANINFEIWSSEPMAIVMVLVPSYSKRDNDDDDGDVVHTCMPIGKNDWKVSQSIRQAFLVLFHFLFAFVEYAYMHVIVKECVRVMI